MVPRAEAQVGFHLLQVPFKPGYFFAQTLAFLDEGCSPGGVFLALDELGHLVLALLHRLGFLSQPLALVIELDDAVHVGPDIAVAAVCFDRLQVLAHKLYIQHYGRFSNGTYGTSLLPT